MPAYYIILLAYANSDVKGENMKLQESGEMYLETIYILSQDNPEVHSVDVA